MPEYDLSELPAGARRLLLGPIDSFEKLELIIALRDSRNPTQGLDDLESRIGAPKTVLERAIHELTAAGVVVQRAGRCVLAPDCDHAAVDELLQVWSSSRTAVLNVMTYRALERIRGTVAHTFAGRVQVEAQ